MTKLKPQDRRIPFNRMVHPRTAKAIKRIAKRKGISEGKVIDAAVAVLVDAEGEQKRVRKASRNQ